MENVKTKHIPYGPYEKYIKRPLDILCGLAAVVVFWWLYLILIVLQCFKCKIKDCIILIITNLSLEEIR